MPEGRGHHGREVTGKGRMRLLGVLPDRDQNEPFPPSWGCPELFLNSPFRRLPSMPIFRGGFGGKMELFRKEERPDTGDSEGAMVRHLAQEVIYKCPADQDSTQEIPEMNPE